MESSEPTSIGAMGGGIEVGGCCVVFPKDALIKPETFVLTAHLPGPIQSEYLLDPLILKCEPSKLFPFKFLVKIESNFTFTERESSNYEVQESDDGEIWKRLSVRCHVEGIHFIFQTKHASMWRVKLQKPDPEMKINLISVIWKRSANELIWNLCKDFTLIRKQIGNSAISNRRIIVRKDEDLTFYIEEVGKQILDIDSEKICIRCNQVFECERLICIDDAQGRHAIKVTLISGDDEVYTDQFRWKVETSPMAKESRERAATKTGGINVENSKLKGVVLGSTNASVKK
uniref:uncharacterized protein LOC108950613 n=1 Tax=Ciona intestinalis TaxID=7719 RepID=UPI000EF51C46|nr:uncharacterized protein LOC108950613 [Ciona intestinalis]|eukprot:XP_026695359.1 uncharacterized protein LOC108950613 [Ciona intestinalis]